MSARNLACAAALLSILLLIAALSAADEWKKFLVPTRNGSAASATGLLDSWPADGPKEIWRVPGGVGMSGITISGGNLCTLIQKGGQQWLVALDPLTGKQQWETAL